MRVFDITFDETFGGLLVSGEAPTTEGCRQGGVYLTWLGWCGWHYWLFEGYSDTDRQPKVVGTFRQAGLLRATQRESGEVITCRTQGLTRPQAELVTTLSESVAVYVLARSTGEATLTDFVPLPVYVEPATVAVWRDAAGSAAMEFKLVLPTRLSVRA